MGTTPGVIEAGSMNIIDLDQRRRETQEAAAPDYTTCPCGEAWFELRNSGDVAPNGAVCLAADGERITGYSGHPHCIACGTPYAQPLSVR